MPRIAGLAVVLAAVALVCAAFVVTEEGDAPTPAPVPGALIEEFEGDTLDRSVWGTCHWWAPAGCTIGSNEELEWYVPEQVSVADGVLRLTAERRDVEGDEGEVYPYASGMISSGPPYDEDEARFAFVYGRAEIRARVPSGRGLWSAFWLLPADKESRPEIDVMEVLGDSPSTHRMHFHYLDDDDERRSLGRDWEGPDLSEGWHDFAVDWEPGVLVWSVDGVERWRVEGDMVPDAPMYLVANLAVGGEWPGEPDEETRFPAALEIDRITVTPR